MSNRENILAAVAEAAHFLEEHWDDHTKPLDLTSAVQNLQIPLMYRPLGNLLGATICPDRDTCGILITSKRPRTVQRFTLAHELGHVVLGHKMKMDTHETVAFRGSTDRRPTEEQAADHFAAQILAPRSLLARIASSQKWVKADLQKPEIIYQLALRLGLSFMATCIALENHRLISSATVDSWQKRREFVKKIKKHWLKDHQVPDYHGDVWWLTDGDLNSRIEANPGDVFLIPVEENSGSGFTWKVHVNGEQRKTNSFADQIISTFGSPQPRHLVIERLEIGQHWIDLVHSRPWNNEVCESRRLTIDTWGREPPGLPRAHRSALLAQVVE